jgi:hypothetical protein
VPFNIWCSQCGEHIAKGVRFNAEKQAVGAYHSTKIWSFTMRHHCGCKITIQTDPKNAEYVVTAGAQRKVRGSVHTQWAGQVPAGSIFPHTCADALAAWCGLSGVCLLGLWLRGECSKHSPWPAGCFTTSQPPLHTHCTCALAHSPTLPHPPWCHPPTTGGVL